MCWHSKTQTWLQALGHKTYLARVALFIIVCCGFARIQTTREFHQTIATSIAQPVSLKVELLEGDLEIAYSREGVVSVDALGQTATANAPVDFLANSLSIANAGNQIEIRQKPSNDAFPSPIKIAYRIDVPYRTEVYSFVKSGKQTITGLMGPVATRGGATEILRCPTFPKPSSHMPLQAIWTCKSSATTLKPPPVEATSRVAG